MYIWRIQQLKEELITDGLSQKETFAYILAFVLLYELLSTLTYLSPTWKPPMTADYVQAFVEVGTVGIGTYLSYYFNGGDAGRQFAERYFSISIVVSIRFMSLMLPLSIGYKAMIEGTGIDGMLLYNLSAAFISLAMIGIYWRIIVHIREVAGAESA